MEIARVSQELAQHFRAIDEPPCDEMHDLILPLPLAMHLEQTRVDQGTPVLLPHPFPDDDIHLSGLILQRQESDTARCLRPLTHEDDARCAHLLAIGNTVQLVGTQKLFLTQPLTQ